jgi:DNA-directed RNA polymerase omega subunit
MDLISLPTELDREKIENRFRLVIAVIKRAKALHQGAMPKIVSRAKKTTTVALEEVVSGSVRVLSGKAAIKAKEASNKLSYKDMSDEATLNASMPEELTKLEKELQIYMRDKEGVIVENNT